MFSKSKDHNINYLASIVRIDSFRSHPNADRLLLANVQGNVVITGINSQPGLYCYFPLECAISKDFLSYSNSYSDKDLNADKTTKAFFSSSGRVKALSLRSQKSEGYIIPVSSLESFIKDVLGKTVVIDGTFEGTDFDTILDHQLCRKYIPQGQRIPNNTSKKTRGNVKKYQSKLVENQFHFHPSTEQLKKNMSKLAWDDTIAITEKYHGTSFVVSNVIVKKKLSLKEKIAKFFGADVKDTEYGILFSSRSVIKNQALNDDKENNHYYDTDVWKIASDRLSPSLKQGYSFYGEIVGYTPTGAMIQKPYDYGCAEGSLDCIVYRMTFTNNNGDVFELSHPQMVEYCNRYGIKTPYVHYYGKVKDLYDLQKDNHWQEDFLQQMIDDYLEKDCRYCVKVPNTPAEGVIVRVDKPNQWEVYKLKSFRFLTAESIELDKGEIDTETQESIIEEI